MYKNSQNRMNPRQVFLTLAALTLLTLGISQAQAQMSGNSENIQPHNYFPEVRLFTSAGEIVVELNRLRAPIAANNFLQYVADGQYDNTIFHRVIEDFVVQGGGFTPEWEPIEVRDPIFNESGNGLTNDRGTIAMARQRNPHSSTSQFYFNVDDNESLDPSSRRWGYTVFGRVQEGMEVIDAIAEMATHREEETGYQDVPVEQVVLERVEIIADDTEAAEQ